MTQPLFCMPITVMGYCNPSCPKKNGTINESGVTLHEMQFDSLAHLKSFETPKTTNMFLKDIDSYKTGQSVTTYVYTGHLCTQAVEKIPVEFDGGTKH